MIFRLGENASAFFASYNYKLLLLELEGALRNVGGHSRVELFVFPVASNIS